MGWAAIIVSEVCSICGERRELATGRWRYDPRVDRRWACWECK